MTSSETLTATGADQATVQAYLERIGIHERPEPSPQSLRALHAAHARDVPFATLDKPDSIDVAFSVDRIVNQRRGGICYHLDGAFGWLLSALGFTVGLHPAGTQSRWARGPQEPNGTHVVLIVRDLPDATNPEGSWVADVGAGEGFCAPLPLHAGEYPQGGFTYRMRPSDLDPRWWRFDYDRRESCRGVDFAETPVALADLHDTYTTLAETDMSIFFRYGWVKRHTEDGYDELIGCQLSAVTGTGRTSSTITSGSEYFAALAEIFGLTYDELGADGREALWQRVSQAWTAEGFAAELPPTQSGAQQ